MIGAARFTYNRLVAYNEELYRLCKVKVFCEPVVQRMQYLREVIESSKTLKNSAPFLSETHDDIIQNAIRNYHTAWKNFREGHAEIPTFHKKGYGGSCQVNSRYKADSEGINDCSGAYFVDRKHMQIPGLGRIKTCFSPKLLNKVFAHSEETRIGTVTLEKDSVGEYWISVLLASDTPFVDPLPETNSALGLDLNLSNFATDSDGNTIDNPKFLVKNKDLLAKEQRVMSRRMRIAKKEGKDLVNAKNYQKQRAKVAKLHRKIEGQRTDFINVLAKQLVENQNLIVFEDLNVRGLLKNHKLARAISDAGWRSFVTVCEQKAAMYNRCVIKVPANYTTQTCSVCGQVSQKKILLGVEDWTCEYCGTHHLRDHNAAKNILYKGLASLLEDPMRYATAVNVLSLADQHLLCESALSESALSGKRV